MQRLSAAEYQKLSAAPKRHKYHAKPVTVGEEFFPSTGEYIRWQTLLTKQALGEISELERQKPYELFTRTGKALGKIVIDFVYRENGILVGEDFKGVLTPFSKWKLQHLAADYDLKVVISRRGKEAAPMGRKVPCRRKGRAA